MPSERISVQMFAIAAEPWPVVMITFIVLPFTGYSPKTTLALTAIW